MVNMVNDLLIKYVGGETFFDALDEEIRINDEFEGFIVSGKFGKRFKDFYLNNYHPNKEVLVCNGALRKGNDIGLDNYDLNNKKYIFLDDSFWSGKTRDVVQKYIEENNGIFLKSYVFYDGNKEKSQNVESFYRYYDFH